MPRSLRDSEWTASPSVDRQVCDPAYLLESSFEISSMGIRVDPPTLSEQLAIRGLEERTKLEFHQRLLAGELPQTMGRGIGQSRLCMFYLRAAHIGEVACGIWPEAMVQACAARNIAML